MRVESRSAGILLGCALAAVVSGCSGSAEDDVEGCSPLSQQQVTRLVGSNSENFKAGGPFTVSAAQQALVEGNEFFTGVVYLKGEAPGVDTAVYVFARTSADIGVSAGGLLGADPFTRERWVWGDVAERGAPIEDAAQDAVVSAPVCLS